ncbi:MAG: C-terminal helicase domain-containing protein, partial [Verrucomicrobiota bacterium]
PCVVYRGEMDKVERRKNLQMFRAGEVDLLISTDLASRGLDVEHVGRVINYHLPQQMANYLHRVGRTARAGRPGLVVNFVTERDAPLVSKLDEVEPATRSSSSTTSTSTSSRTPRTSGAHRDHKTSKGSRTSRDSRKSGGSRDSRGRSPKARR